MITCGNGKIDAGENCDGSNLGGKRWCSDLGFDAGILSCSTDCTFDTSGCVGSPNLSGLWRLTVKGCFTDKDGDVTCPGPTTVYIDVTQIGNQLSGSLLIPAGDLPAECSATCIPATPNCAELFELTGTVSGNSVTFTVTQNQSFQIDCGVCDFHAEIFDVQQYQGTIVGRTINGSVSEKVQFSCKATPPCDELLECVDSTGSGSFEVLIL